MKEEITICPITETNTEHLPNEQITPIMEYLQTQNVLPENQIVFPIGTLTNDGRLDLCKQSLGVQGAMQISDALKENAFVKHLLLGTNGLGNEGAKNLAQVIEKNESLETLYLGCNRIEAEGAISLCKALEENKNIKSVWFKRNPIGKESVPALINLLKKNVKIRTLDLVNTCLAEGFLPFFEYLAENASLERIYLSGNYLKVNQIETLSKALAQNTTLKALFLSVNDFENDGAKFLAEGLAQNTTLTELSLASCGISEEGFLALIKAFSRNPNLAYVDFGYASSTRVLQAKANDISNHSAEKLFEWAKNAANLKYLNLSKTNLSEKYKTLFANLQGKCVVMEGVSYQNNYLPHPDSQAIKSVYR
jgi:Ran GTPase-activating protein (RanGAP) involved in mRNA processing and transport